MDINHFAKRCFLTAVRREQITDVSDLEDMHVNTLCGLMREAEEVRYASETEMSEHLPSYTETAEELADVAIVCLTELFHRGVNVEKILTEKAKFNERRI